MKHLLVLLVLMGLTGCASLDWKDLTVNSLKGAEVAALAQKESFISQKEVVGCVFAESMSVVFNTTQKVLLSEEHSIPSINVDVSACYAMMDPRPQPFIPEIIKDQVLLYTDTLLPVVTSVLTSVIKKQDLEEGTKVKLENILVYFEEVTAEIVYELSTMDGVVNLPSLQ
jgi:hypothetical protein